MRRRFASGWYGWCWIPRPITVALAGGDVDPAKIGCAAQTLHQWVRKAEVDSGRRAGMPTEVAVQLKALERE